MTDFNVAECKRAARGIARSMFNPCRVAVIGSSTIPGSDPNDIDFIVYTEEDWSDVIKTLKDYGWTKCVRDDGYPIGSSMYSAWRRGVLNCMVTRDMVFFENTVKANDLCVKLKLLNKDDRIAVYDAIRGDY